MKNRRKEIYAANWKMNLNSGEIRGFMKEIVPFVNDVADAAAEVMIFPPSLYLPLVAELANGSRIGVGAQNMFWEREGAYTGEISALMIKDCHAGYVLCGHSERRHYFGESAEMVTRKAGAAQAEGLIPMICVGETLEEREQGETLEVLHNDIYCSLSAVEPDENVIIAYEPVWAIGTGLTATPADAEAAICYIRGQVRELWGDIADAVRILYGGSVKPGNIAELMACPNIDGALVGGASLHACDFAAIIKNGVAK